jgi:hypothetical protein
MGGRIGGVAGIDPQAMREMMSLLRQRPERIEMTLTDTLFTITLLPGAPMALPMSGDEVELEMGGVVAKVRVVWDALQPRLERSIEGGGTIVDRLEVAGEGRLLLTRSVELLRRDVELRFAYDRAEEGQAWPRPVI